MLFYRVDKDHSGQISVNELQSALSNGKIVKPVWLKRLTNSGFKQNVLQNCMNGSVYQWTLGAWKWRSSQALYITLVITTF